MRCLIAVTACLDYVRKTSGVSLAGPLMMLAEALDGLDEGYVAPFLRSRKFKCRPPDRMSLHAVRATTAAALEILEGPRLRLEAAATAAEIGAVVTRAGLTIKGPSKDGGARAVTGSDVMAWRRRYQKAAGEGCEIYRMAVGGRRYGDPSPAAGSRAIERRELLTHLHGYVTRYVEFNSP